MTDSILTSVKKVLGLAEDYEEFDQDIIMHINSTFSTLHQLGIGPSEGFMIEDADDVWDDFLAGDNRFNSVKTYVSRKVRIVFDPPAASHHLEAMKQQNVEDEWRLNVVREGILDDLDDASTDGDTDDGTI